MTHFFLPMKNLLKSFKGFIHGPGSKNQARIQFCAVTPDDKYGKALVLLEKLWKAAGLCKMTLTIIRPSFLGH